MEQISEQRFILDFAVKRLQIVNLSKAIVYTNSKDWTLSEDINILFIQKFLQN